MIIEDFGLKIMEFEALLQKITTDMTSEVIFERLPPSELWRKSENYVASLKSLAEQLKDVMLLLRPERAVTIKRQFHALTQPLTAFKDLLFQKSADPLANSKLALEQLKRGLVESSDFLELAKDVKLNLSKSISAVLKLKEVYGAKEYLSNVSVPEAVYSRVEGLRRSVEDLNLYVSDLKRALEELTKRIDNVQKEISKFQPLSAETPAETASSEPTLVSKDNQ